VQLYLPIADIPVNVFLILAMGAAVGFVSGMFGIGGGFLMTPLLIFVGIAPAVAVASVASHIAASSFSGALSYWRRRAIDPALALVLLSGGTVGTGLGVWTFTLLRSLGQLDLMIALSYVIPLTTVGPDVLGRLRAILRAARRGTLARRSGSHGWITACR
jgi:uncharacterized membrane protein YfcA